MRETFRELPADPTNAEADRDTRRVVITGAAGFIGRHLVADQLQRGRRVVAVDLDIEPLDGLGEEPNLTLLEGDFRDRSLLDPHLPNTDACFHLASVHLESGVREDEYWQVNVVGARDLAERCHGAQIGRFVHCSSVGVYGELRDPPADEASSRHPDTAYERTKLAGEEAVREYARQSGLPTVIIRPSWVYGPGCPRTEKLFSSIQRGWFFFVGNRESMRHPIFIEDMVDAFETAATHPAAPGETFVIAGPQAITITELATEIAAVLQARPPRLRLPRNLVWFGCSLLELGSALLGREAPFTRRSMKFFTGNSAFDTSKAERQLGFRPVIALEEGLIKTIELSPRDPQSVKSRRRGSRITSQ